MTINTPGGGGPADMLLNTLEAQGTAGVEANAVQIDGVPANAGIRGDGQGPVRIPALISSTRPDYARPALP